MVNNIDKRTSFKYMCEVGSNLIPAKDLEECLYIARSYGPCAVFKLSGGVFSKYNYICDLFIDECLKGGDE